MTVRIHLDSPLPAEGSEFALPDGPARHVVQVLRMRVGEALRLFDGHGDEAEATIIDAGRRELRVRLGARCAVDRESPLAITLVQGIAKGDRMDYTIQKAVELGVQRIVPVLTERSVVRVDAERWDRKREHWRGIAISACEQSGRARLPEIAEIGRLGDWLTATRHDDAPRLLLAPTAASGLRGLPAARRVAVVIGPEGGLSEAEIALGLDNGCTPVRIGPRVLRTETAGVAVLAALQALWGDWG